MRGGDYPRFEVLRRGFHVLVTSAAEVHDDGVVVGGDLLREREPVGGFERRDDALGLAEFPKRRERFVVGHRPILTPSDSTKHRVFGAHTRIVEPRRDRVDLDVVVDDLRPHPVKHVLVAGRQRCGVAFRISPLATAFAAVEFDGIVAEGVKQPHCVRPAADARHRCIGQLAGFFSNLFAGFLADDRVELPNHPRERVGTHHRSDEVVSVVHVRSEIFERGVDGVG